MVPAPATKKVLLAVGLVDSRVTAKEAVVHDATFELQNVAPEPGEKARAPHALASTAPSGQYVFVALQVAPVAPTPPAQAVPAGQRACAAKGALCVAHAKPGAHRGPAVALPLPGAKQKPGEHAMQLPAIGAL